MTPGVANDADFPRDSKIATRHELTSSRCCDAVDGGNDRFRATHDGLHRGGASLHCLLEKCAAMIGVLAARGHFFQVVTGAKGRRRAPYYDRGDVLRLAIPLDARVKGGDQV